MSKQSSNGSRMHKLWIGLALLTLLCAPPLWAQQEVRSSTKGLTGPMPITGTSIDSDHNALDVYPRGSGPNGESAVTLGTTQAGEDVLNDVQKTESQYDYETVAASQTDQVLGTTGAAGDLLHAVHCVWTAAPAAATSIKDGAGSAMNIFEIKGGAGSQTVILDLVSADGGWKLTTSTNMTCIGIGRFS